MTKIIKKTKILITLLTISIFATSLAACSNNEKTPETTTQIKETPETTTVKEVETTTEEVTTEYKYKGEIFAVSVSKKDMFNGLIVENGTTIYINDIVGPNDGDDLDRGYIAKKLAIILYSKHSEKLNEFYDTYWKPGSDTLKIGVDENAFIKYTGDEKYKFEYVKEDNEYVWFDVYEVE